MCAASPATVDLLPEIYRQFLPHVFHLPPPPEVFATCANCAMVNNTSSGPGKLRTFHPDLKCCTFHPHLPNYLVGALLAQESSSSEGHVRILRAIQARSGVSPGGIAPPKVYSLLYHNKDPSAFGNSHGLLCPYYETTSGLCSVWKYREAVCSTFYCKCSGGKDGKDFWEAMKHYLFLTESTLKKYVILKLCPGNATELIAHFNSRPAGQGPLSAADIDQSVDDADYRNLWREWQGRESQFFVEAYNLVAALTETEFRHLLGVEHEVKLRILREKHDRMVFTPGKLKRTPTLHPKTDDGGFYNVSLPTVGATMRVPVGLLDSFDGNAPTEENVEKANAAYNSTDAGDMVWILSKHGILLNQSRQAEGEVQQNAHTTPVDHLAAEHKFPFHQGGAEER